MPGFGPHLRAAGVNVNSVAPGQIKTPMLLTDLDPAVYERMTKETPLGFVGEPEDIAGVVVFLASTHAALHLRRHDQCLGRLSYVLSQKSG